MPFYVNLPQAALGSVLLAVGTLATRAAARHFFQPRWLERLLSLGTLAWLAVSLDLGLPAELHQHSPSTVSVWSSAIALFWVGISAGIAVFLRFRAPARAFDPSRRRLLTGAGATALAAPLAATGYGMYVANRTPKVTEMSIPVAELHPDLEGLRIVQLSDIHLSPFFSRGDLSRAVSLANETRAHIAVVTGDLISSAADPLEDCIQELRRLRSVAGTLGCLGNHEVYAKAEDLAELLGRKAGIEFLRGSARQLRFGRAAFNIAGVDYQRKGFPYLRGVGALVNPETPNLLLSHSPDVLPVAAELGFDVMLSGHTHGGQVTVEILHQSITPARFYTPFVRGLYTHGRTSAYVNTGLGTVGAPIRIGAEPEIALIRLVKA